MGDGPAAQRPRLRTAVHHAARSVGQLIAATASPADEPRTFLRAWFIGADDQDDRRWWLASADAIVSITVAILLLAHAFHPRRELAVYGGVFLLGVGLVHLIAAAIAGRPGGNSTNRRIDLAHGVVLLIAGTVCIAAPRSGGDVAATVVGCYLVLDGILSFTAAATLEVARVFNVVRGFAGLGWGSLLLDWGAIDHAVMSRATAALTFAVYLVVRAAAGTRAAQVLVAARDAEPEADPTT